MLHVLFKRDVPQARLQRRYMERGQYDLCIDDGKQVTRLTSHEWTGIEAGTTIVMRIVFKQVTHPKVEYKCHFCGAVNHIVNQYSLQHQGTGSINCRECKRRFQISRESSSAKRSAQSSGTDFVPETEAEMHLIRNFHIRQISSGKDNINHPRITLHNKLQMTNFHARLTWKIDLQGPPNTLTWYAAVYSMLAVKSKMVHTNQTYS
ncbi:uncharacterized protein EDB93DRAFT_544596 [Suillus bovinus]|uniref:uncharacterized protein n=1 Tax=Suillus bovinus TaxID=48563 RepID=UPI001B86F913|nr:uncharacterized protein EDB93DRAFT_544596 [Suillus bovinus]KAG2144114.1 hypothetical protein EDB93DRAFT_544596 [Suillus bovinus]